MKKWQGNKYQESENIPGKNSLNEKKAEHS